MDVRALLVNPLPRAVTYTRWLHILMGCGIALVCASVYPGLTDNTPIQWALVPLTPIPLLLVAAMFPATRLAEGLQARLMLLPGRYARGGDGTPADANHSGIVAEPSVSWSDRMRTAVWLVLRLEVGCLVALLTVQLMGLTLTVIGAAMGYDEQSGVLSRLSPVPWMYPLLIPVPALVLLYTVALVGVLMTAAARFLLGPSPMQRLAAAVRQAEQLLERNRIARELHDSIGHALTAAVLQSGAAREARDSEFTERALSSIEETCRTALEELEHVLQVLQEPEQARGRHFSLVDMHRLLDSATASGADVEAEVTGPLDRVPRLVSREGYRILQESLTNALRHSGTEHVSVRVRIEATEGRLVLEVRNPLARTHHTDRKHLPTGGRGLHGIRKRAALLGGMACAGPHAGEWRVRVEFPLGDIV